MTQEEFLAKRQFLRSMSERSSSTLLQPPTDPIVDLRMPTMLLWTHLYIADPGTEGFSIREGGTYDPYGLLSAHTSARTGVGAYNMTLHGQGLQGFNHASSDQIKVKMNNDNAHFRTALPLPAWAYAGGLWHILVRFLCSDMSIATPALTDGDLEFSMELSVYNTST